MRGLAVWASQWCQRWLDGFKSQYGLSSIPAALSHVSSERTLLHVGCGMATMEQINLPGFKEAPWREVRLDADPAVKPDILATMVNMAAVPDEFTDAIFSSHGIEHLYWHDVPRALAEFFRVLDSQGFAVITCPDVQAAAEMIAQDRMFDTAYMSDAGAITPFDILYSYRPFVEANPQWMAHHCGFTLTTLIQAVKAAGFPSYYGMRRIGGFDLWILASKTKRSEIELAALAGRFLPAVN